LLKFPWFTKESNLSIFCCEELAQKSSETTAARKRDVSDSVDDKTTSYRTDRVRLLPWSDDGDAHLLSLMLDVTRQVSALQDAVADMRQENKVNYRQLKRQMMKLGSSRLSLQDNRNRPTNFDSRPRSFVQSGT